MSALTDLHYSPESARLAAISLDEMVRITAGYPARSIESPVIDHLDELQRLTSDLTATGWDSHQTGRFNTVLVGALRLTSSPSLTQLLLNVHRDYLIWDAVSG